MRAFFFTGDERYSDICGKFIGCRPGSLWTGQVMTALDAFQRDGHFTVFLSFFYSIDEFLATSSVIKRLFR